MKKTISMDVSHFTLAEINNFVVQNKANFEVNNGKGVVTLASIDYTPKIKQKGLIWEIE